MQFQVWEDRSRFEPWIYSEIWDDLKSELEKYGVDDVDEVAHRIFDEVAVAAHKKMFPTIWEQEYESCFKEEEE